jgi:hypothetical protein
MLILEVFSFNLFESVMIWLVHARFFLILCVRSLCEQNKSRTAMIEEGLASFQTLNIAFILSFFFSKKKKKTEARL